MTVRFGSREQRVGGEDGGRSVHEDEESWQRSIEAVFDEQSQQWLRVHTDGRELQWSFEYVAMVGTNTV